MVYVYVDARARRDFPQWLGEYDRSFHVEAYDEHGQMYSRTYLFGSLRNVYDDLKGISLGKESESMALLYIDHPTFLLALIARTIISKGKDMVKFRGPKYNKKGGSNVYKKKG